MNLSNMAGVSDIISTANLRASMAGASHTSELERFQEIFTQLVSEFEERETIDRAQFRQAAEMFESYFIQMMFQAMRSTTFRDNAFIPESHAERVFTEMLDETLADAAAQQGGFGLADMIYQQMTMRF